MKIVFVVLVAGLSAVGCGSDPAPAPDMAVAADLSASPDLTMAEDLASSSSCGQPGDPGNALGVGKYCTGQGDCGAGTICTHLFDPTVYFCTKACSSNGASNQCGDGAVCQCQSVQCGCVPAVCVSLPEG
jgi:hypothetical protein